MNIDNTEVLLPLDNKEDIINVGAMLDMDKLITAKFSELVALCSDKKCPIICCIEMDSNNDTGLQAVMGNSHSLRIMHNHNLKSIKQIEQVEK